MRKTTTIVLILLIVAGGGLLIAAHTLLKPLARDAEAGRLLTRYLAGRGEIEEGTVVEAWRRPASERRLATEGVGLVIVLTPAPEVRRTPGALSALAVRAAREGVREYARERVDWVEVVIRVDGEDGPRCLLQLGPGGELGPPEPPLPARLEGEEG